MLKYQYKEDPMSFNLLIYFHRLLECMMLKYKYKSILFYKLLLCSHFIVYQLFYRQKVFSDISRSAARSINAASVHVSCVDVISYKLIEYVKKCTRVITSTSLNLFYKYLWLVCKKWTNYRPFWRSTHYGLPSCKTPITMHIGNHIIGYVTNSK